MFGPVFAVLTIASVPPPAPCGPVPSATQLDRLRLGTCALVHLGLATFLDREPAAPGDDPSIFRIDDFTARPWIDDVRRMGLDGLVLMVREEDGFPLADTGIVETAARDAAAARMPFGLAIAGRGGTVPLAGEVADLCRRFGPLFEIRIGSEVSAGRADVSGATCPGACIASADGPDFTTAPLGEPVASNGPGWRGVERTVSIRPSWHWRLAEDERVRSVVDLEDAWFASVGHGESLLVGIPSDRDGRFRRGDVERMSSLHRHLATTFERDLAREAIATASSRRGDDPAYAPERAVDADERSFWATDDGVTEAWLELSWPAPVAMNIVEMREPIALGRRCDAWSAELRVDGAWREIARGDSIGFRRIARFPTVKADRLRIRLASGDCPLALERLAVHAAPPGARLVSGETAFTSRTEAILASDHPDAVIRVTLDGRDPAGHGTVVDGPIPIASSCVLRAIATDASGRSGHPISVRFTRTDGAPFLEPVVPEETGGPGLVLEIHDGVDASLDELAGRLPRETSTIEEVRLPVDRPRDRFALVYRGFLRVPADGLYTFALRSDDGSRLYLHDRLVVERDGLQVYDVREGRVALRRGLHPIRVEFCEFEGRESLSLSWSVAGGRLERIPTDAFTR